MKKTASILLLGIFLFNWFGYRLLTSFIEQQANHSLQAALDNNNYSESELVSIKVPINLPYYTNSKHYEPVEGEIEINGTHYNYVKFRLYNDSIEYVCIPNKAKMRLSNARNEFFKLVNDLQQPSQNKKTGHGNNTNFIKTLLTEYYYSADTWGIQACSCSERIYSDFRLAAILPPTLSPQEQPPDA